MIYLAGVVLMYCRGYCAPVQSLILASKRPPCTNTLA
jgi:hypothetical protein